MLATRAVSVSVIAGVDVDADAGVGMGVTAGAVSGLGSLFVLSFFPQLLQPFRLHRPHGCDGWEYSLHFCLSLRQFPQLYAFRAAASGLFRFGLDFFRFAGPEAMVAHSGRSHARVDTSLQLVTQSDCRDTKAAKCFSLRKDCELN